MKNEKEREKIKIGDKANKKKNSLALVCVIFEEEKRR